MRAVEEWGRWLNSTPAMDVYRQRVEENQARQYRAPTPEPPTPPVQPTMGDPNRSYYSQQSLANLEQPIANPRPGPRPAYEPMIYSAASWTPTAGQTQQEQDLNRRATESRGVYFDPLAAWRNATRLPIIGQALEAKERGVIDVGSATQVQYDVTKSERLPWQLPWGETSLGEYAGAAPDLFKRGWDTLTGLDWGNAGEKLTTGNVRRALGETVHQLGPANVARLGEEYGEALQRQRAAAPTDSYTDRMARINSVSGPEATARTRRELLDREPEAARLEQRAQALVTQLENPQLPEAQRAQVAAEAAELGRRANELRQMTPAQIVERNMEFGPELAWSLLLDPLEWMGWLAGFLWRGDWRADGGRSPRRSRPRRFCGRGWRGRRANGFGGRRRRWIALSYSASIRWRARLTRWRSWTPARCMVCMCSCWRTWGRKRMLYGF